MPIVKTVLIFVLAGLCEIGGGYLVWLSVKQGKPFWYAIVGSLILILYGFVATLQPAHFAKVYATYGGYFIVLSLLWAYKFDGYVPNKYEILGAVVALVGVSIIYYAPRN